MSSSGYSLSDDERPEHRPIRARLVVRRGSRPRSSSAFAPNTPLAKASAASPRSEHGPDADRAWRTPLVAFDGAGGHLARAKDTTGWCLRRPPEHVLVEAARRLLLRRGVRGRTRGHAGTQRTQA